MELVRKNLDTAGILEMQAVVMRTELRWPFKWVQCHILEAMSLQV